MGRRPRTQWDDVPIRAKVFTALTMPLIALIATAGAFLFAGRESHRAQDSMVEALRIRQATQAVEVAMQAMDNLVWSEVLMGIPPSEQSKSARKAFTDRLAELRAMVADDPLQRKALEGFEGQIDRRIEAMTKMTTSILAEIKRTGELPDLSGFLNSAGDTFAPEMTLSRVERRADETVSARSEDARHARERVQKTVLAGAGLGAVGGIVLVFLTTGRLARRLRRLEDNARRLADGDPLEAFETSRDEIGRVARELDEASELLQRRQEELRTAKEDAEHSNQAKTEFLSRMSHELRTPLNSVLGFGQLLMMREGDAEDRDSAGHIVRAGRHLLALIDEVLDITRIEGGQFRVSMEPVSLAESLGDTIDLMRPLAEQRGITIHADAAADVWVYADRQRLNQVFLNVLSNAIKFNRPSGRVDVTVDGDQNSVRVSVADTGEGIPGEWIHRLFVPFERLDADRRNVEGTGLGLALSRRLVEAMGGTIEATSVPGEGSTFAVHVGRCGPPAVGEAPAATHFSPQEASRDRAPTVLYIEDNLANLRLVQKILSRLGPTRLVTALQGGLGMDLARQHRPHMILLDLHLPDMHGGDVLRTLKSDPATADIPIVVITADATADAREAVMRDGAAACMTKPLDMMPFIETVEAVLAGSRAVA